MADHVQPRVKARNSVNKASSKRPENGRSWDDLSPEILMLIFELVSAIKRSIVSPINLIK